MASPGPERTARLERVLRHLEDFGDLGTVDDSGQFFGGILPMRWGPTMHGRSLVYFGGRTERTIVGLGGSVGQVLGTGASTPPAPRMSESLLPRLLSGLDTDWAADPAERAGLNVVHQANAGLRGPAQNVEFVAKRLLCGPSPYPEMDPAPDMTVLLGSPLYVAQTD